jgi:hypothetical protein
MIAVIVISALFTGCKKETEEYSSKFLPVKFEYYSKYVQNGITGYENSSTEECCYNDDNQLISKEMISDGIICFRTEYLYEGLNVKTIKYFTNGVLSYYESFETFDRERNFFSYCKIEGSEEFYLSGKSKGFLDGNNFEYRSESKSYDTNGVMFKQRERICFINNNLLDSVKEYNINLYGDRTLVYDNHINKYDNKKGIYSGVKSGWYVKENFKHNLTNFGVRAYEDNGVYMRDSEWRLEYEYNEYGYPSKRMTYHTSDTTLLGYMEIEYIEVD